MPHKSSAPRASYKTGDEIVGRAPHEVKDRFSIEGQDIQRCQRDKKKDGIHRNLRFFYRRVLATRDERSPSQERPIREPISEKRTMSFMSCSRTTVIEVNSVGGAKWALCNICVGACIEIRLGNHRLFISAA